MGEGRWIVFLSKLYSRNKNAPSCRSKQCSFANHSKSFSPSAFSFAPVLFAQETTKQEANRASAGRLLEIKVSAPALKGNLLADPVEQSVAIYLPPSYDTSPAKRFPVVYLLHGFLGDQHAWTSGYQGMTLTSLMDEMIKSGKSRELIVVAPNGKNAYDGAFYANSSVNGNWEDYIFRDLVGYVDANYRTIARPESRGIAGHSMGGYGAVVLGMKHADVFGALYALSPCCLAMGKDFSAENPAWLKTIRLTSKEQLKAPMQSIDDFYEMVFVALSAAFSPNPERAPFYVDFPFQERDGRLEQNAAVYAKWKSKMPLYMIDENKQNLLKLRGYLLTTVRMRSLRPSRVAFDFSQTPSPNEAFPTPLKFTKAELTPVRSDSVWKHACCSSFLRSWISGTRSDARDGQRGNVQRSQAAVGFGRRAYWHHPVDATLGHIPANRV